MTLTVFATVGFCDSTPVTTAARVVSTIQILGDLVIDQIGREAK